MQQAPSKETKKSVQTKENVGSTNNKNEKKGNLFHTILLVLIILVLTLVIALGGIFVFNVAGLKADTTRLLSNVPLLGKIMKPVAENKTAEQLAKDEMAAKEKNLLLEQQKISEREKAVIEKEKTLSDKELELQAKEKEINDKMIQLDDKLASVKEQVEFLEKIEASKAVQILMNMNERTTVVQILRNMKKDKSASIIALMDPLQAAQILEELHIVTKESEVSVPQQ